MNEPTPPLRRYLRSRRIMGADGREIELDRDDQQHPVVWEVDREQLEQDLLATQDRLGEQAEQVQAQLAQVRSEVAEELAVLRFERDGAFELIRQIAAAHPDVASALRVGSDRIELFWLDSLLPDP